MSTYGLDDKINKLQLIAPFRPLGNPLCVDQKMHAIFSALPLLCFSFRLSLVVILFFFF